MKLPNGDKAVVDLAKLRDYCLSSTHLRGRHKARVFEAVLDLRGSDAPEVRDALLMTAATSDDAVVGPVDDFGRRFLLDFVLRTQVAAAVVRSGWIVRSNEDFPRFVTCYVL